MKKENYQHPMTKFVMVRTSGPMLDNPSVTIDGEDMGLTFGSPGDGSDQAGNEYQMWDEAEEEESTWDYSVWKD